MKQRPPIKKKRRATAASSSRANSRYRTTSLNLDKRIFALAQQVVKNSQGKFRSMSALFNFEFSRIYGIK